MKRQYEATIEEDNGISTTLAIKYSVQNTSITWGMNMIIYKVIRDFSIDSENITSIKVTKENGERTIKIEYNKKD